MDTLVQYGFSDSNDSQPATNSRCKRCTFYVPTDNTVANNTELVNNICELKKVHAIIAGEEGISVDVELQLFLLIIDLGVATGKMAVQVLKGV